MQRKPKSINKDAKKIVLPEAGFIRLSTVLQIYPVGRSTWWKLIREKKAPAPVKLSRRCVAWRVADIKALIEEHNNAHSRPRQHTGQFEGQTNQD